MSKRVLVVDDDPVIRSLVSDIVSSFGHSVETLAGGQECMEQLSQQLPDILILDLQMPGMSGLDVLQRIRADVRTAAIPVIMLSANSDASENCDGSCRADRYLMKPFNVMEIVQALEYTNELDPQPAKASA